MGSCTKYASLDVISTGLGANLRDLVDQVADKGFMVRVDETSIRFAHDKIQQAAYEMMSDQEKRESHMRFGLSICSHVLNGSSENDELFFVAVNQINRGGAEVLTDPNQKVMVAKLNLKAGKRAIELSDFSTALKLFEHGTSFLNNEERWTTQYSLSLDLFDAAVETACALNNAAGVQRLSEPILAHGKCNDDKLKCLYAVFRSLRLAFKFQDAKNVGKHCAHLQNDIVSISLS